MLILRLENAPAMRSLPAHREQSTRAESPSQTLGVALRDEVEARRDPGIEAALEKMAEPQGAVAAPRALPVPYFRLAT